MLRNFDDNLAKQDILRRTLEANLLANDRGENSYADHVMQNGMPTRIFVLKLLNLV